MRNTLLYIFLIRLLLVSISIITDIFSDGYPLRKISFLAYLILQPFGTAGLNWLVLWTAYTFPANDKRQCQIASSVL
ncbi:hypothetical protein AV540_14015 [Brevibacillus parabrevis]|nr:hypothetical protein AV540_14015 [Brevibacillus parabrevis]